VAFVHGYTATDAKDKAYNLADRWSLRKASRIVCVSRSLADELERRGIERSKIIVLHNPVRPFEPPAEAAVGPLRARLCAGGGRVILAAGRLSKEKGHADLIEAFAVLRRLHPDLGAQLVIVGSGPERGRLEKQCERLGLRELVWFEGQQADVRPYYALAEVVALPSWTEGSPNVILEALSAGRPVVATEVGGVPEMLTQGQTGLLVPPRDPKAMAEALANVLSDRALGSRLAEAGSHYVQAHHARVDHRRAMLNFYRGITGSVQD